MLKQKWNFQENTLKAVKGFTLIEALTVLAIIGILAAFAIPSYRDYIAKTRIAELFNLAKPAQLGVADALYSGVAKAEINNKSAGVHWEPEQHARIQAMEVAQGNIEITGRAIRLSIPDAAENDLLIVRLEPDEQNGILNWQCRYHDKRYARFLPQHCTLIQG